MNNNNTVISSGAEKLRNIYAIKPNAPIYRREFGYYSMERWISEGHIKNYDDIARICEFDSGGQYGFHDLGWTEAAFDPAFPSKILEDRGDYELVQDHAGRGVLFFKGRRNGFMPEYITHPVTDQKSWEENCLWRLQPTESRLQRAKQNGVNCAEHVVKTRDMVTEYIGGGYQYLRSLFGPEGLLYMFYDNPKLIHTTMETWLKIACAVVAEHQKNSIIDEVFLSEDICYKTNSLISPDMMKEFLFPYYQQLLTSIRAHQPQKQNLFVQIDTDGCAEVVIPLYREAVGMNVMSPFEVAAGCDIVRVAKMYPDMVLTGGIDKRILSGDRDGIDRMLERIMVPLRKRGGYIPTCDHGVPEEVSFDNYIFFRKRLNEYCG